MEQQKLSLHDSPHYTVEISRQAQETLTTLKYGVRNSSDAAMSGVVKFEKPPNIPLSVAGTDW